MKTEAPCPSCDFPFSFWRVAFALSPFNIFCRNCGSRIVIKGDKSIIWAMLVVLALISFVLFRFIVARDFMRLVLLTALWLALFEILEIVVALMIVNWGQFSKLPQSESSDGS
jgi:hypothetical protein